MATDIAFMDCKDSVRKVGNEVKSQMDSLSKKDDGGDGEVERVPGLDIVMAYPNRQLVMEEDKDPRVIMVYSKDELVGLVSEEQAGAELCPQSLRV